MQIFLLSVTCKHTATYYPEQYIKGFLVEREDLLLTFVAEGIVLEE